jgi:hypothetical protein
MPIPTAFEIVNRPNQAPGDTGYKIGTESPDALRERDQAVTKVTPEARYNEFHDRIRREDEERRRVAADERQRRLENRYSGELDTLPDLNTRISSLESEISQLTEKLFETKEQTQIQPRGLQEIIKHAARLPALREALPLLQNELDRCRQRKADLEAKAQESPFRYTRMLLVGSVSGKLTNSLLPRTPRYGLGETLCILRKCRGSLACVQPIRHGPGGPSKTGVSFPYRNCSFTLPPPSERRLLSFGFFFAGPSSGGDLSADSNGKQPTRLYGGRLRRDSAIEGATVSPLLGSQGNDLACFGNRRQDCPLHGSAREAAYQ